MFARPSETSLSISSVPRSVPSVFVICTPSASNARNGVDRPVLASEIDFVKR